ncbi:CHAT domain-containing protein [Crocosphaera sp. XPORK-15E]|uniref:CHAT domain-containing protein n=1 Tax=Crocosphaera sp. XPORK-15E TaxID=3110247 RepID=UPI002B1ED994|nr:CHAT domain-containing protein [Crocosphaera sp. XPORK-15E]MEA5537359.1 CHAT domain-containing protein [Crocosphaera sp. XPORK-15E]
MFPFPRLIQVLSIFVLGILLSISCHLPTWGQSPASLYEQASLKWQEGQTTTAIALWQQVIENTPHQNLKGRAYFMLAQAYLELGFIHQASQAWEQGNLLSSPFPTLTPFAKGIEGNLALAKGDFEQAIAAYEKVPENLAVLNHLSLAYQELAQQKQQRASSAALEGDLEEESLKLQGAEAFEKGKKIAQRAIALASDEVSLNAAQSWIRWAKFGEPNGVQSALDILKQLPDSFHKGLQLLEISQLNPLALPLAESVAITLNHPILLAQVERLSAQVLEKEGNYEKALERTLKAYGFVAQSNLELLSQIQWDLGRLFNQLEQPQNALKYYHQAINSTEELRKQLASGTRSVQLAFQTKTNPLYRELLGVLLKSPTQKNLKKAIGIKQQFQLAELESYFGHPCQLESSKSPQTIPNQVIIYTIILPDALHEILEFSDGQYRHRVIKIPQAKLESLIREWRINLEDEFTFNFRATAELFYDWLIAPWTEELQGIKTLIFVNDGVLWSVPMTALWKHQYLIESYQIAYSLGLEVSNNNTLETVFPVFFGTTQSSERFQTPLPFVQSEVLQIINFVGGKAYLDDQFSFQQFDEALKSQKYTVLHLASHANFGSFEKSFIQTGTGLLSLEEFEKLLRARKAPIQLLTLSGCQTAVGNDQAVLGMAGVAIRAKIPSVLGTLWFVSDSATSQLMVNFYQTWNKDSSPLESLRQSQIKLIQSASLSHPRFWSAYLFLIN